MESIPKLKGPFSLDDKDRQILKVLSENSRLSYDKIAIKTGLSATTVFNRIKKMEKNKIIEKYTVKLDKSVLKGAIVAFILLQISNVDQKDVVKKIMEHDNIEEASIITGENDILLRIRIHSIDELNKFILEYLRRIPGITNSTTMIALDFIEK